MSHSHACSYKQLTVIKDVRVHENDGTVDLIILYFLFSQRVAVSIHEILCPVSTSPYFCLCSRRTRPLKG